MHSSSFLSSGLALLVATGPLACAAAPSAFQSPEAKYRPKFRYWLPDASVPAAAVAADVRTLASAGAGGLELLGYYQYGLPEAERGVQPPTDWAQYGFGTPAFKDIFVAVLTAAKEAGVLVDFAQGANQGQGVPAEPGTEGLAVELAYANVTVAAGATFDGALPWSSQPSNPFSSFMHSPEEFGEQNLTAVQAVEVVSESEVSAGSGSFSSSFPGLTLGEVVDLTSSVGSNNSLTWTAPEGNSTWRLIAWYTRYTNQRSCSGGVNATNALQNGSWTVDHFSAQGSKKLTDFLDANLFDDADTKALIAEVGEYGWEDSMEMVSSLWWAPDFPDKFKQARGYDATPCFPYFITPGNYWNGGVVPYGEAFLASNATFQQKCNEDYRTTLNEGYQEYLAAYVEWAKGLGVEYSAQPAYNLPLNMLNDIPILNAPEGESLGFDNIPDTYRQFSGPAHLSGISVVSSECGALSGAPYQQTLNDLLWSVRRGLATGISMNVLHGYAYSGEYTNTTWPSYTTFTYRFTEMWNQHQPSWRHINDSLNYIARNQYVSQIGTPSIDLVFYHYSAPWLVEEQYTNTNLETLGYTYDYLTTNNLQAAEAVVENGVLAPSGPGYKALIFSNQTEITPGAAAKVQEFASAGLPVFFVGATNFTAIGMTPGDEDNVTSTMSAVVNSGLENVRTVASADDLPDALSSADIAPKVSFSGGVPSWYSFWRRAEGIDYAFIYNDGSESQSVDVTFATSGSPYFFDAWTGDVTPVLQYTANTTGVTIPITLASNQTTVIGFTPSNSISTSDIPAAPSVHVTASSGSVSGFRYANNSIYAQLSSSSSASSVTLSTGQMLNVSATTAVPEVSNLTSWDIVIEDWHRTADAFSMDTAVTLHNYTDAALAPWTELDADALTGVSGIGTYTTNFTSPAGAGSFGAVLHLGPVTNTIRAWLNGRLLPPIDITDAVVDVSEYVAADEGGANALEVEVTTTLFNRIKADGNSTWSVGVTANAENGAFYAVNAPKTYGLLGPVWVEWVALEKVA